MDDLYEYYWRCDYAASARNHVAFAGVDGYISRWCEPVQAYRENMARMCITHQCDYEDMRDDIDGTLLY